MLLEMAKCAVNVVDIKSECIVWELPACPGGTPCSQRQSSRKVGWEEEDVYLQERETGERERIRRRMVRGGGDAAALPGGYFLASQV